MRISVRKACRGLEIDGKSARFITRLPSALGATYGGVWFDWGLMRFHLAVTHGAEAAASKLLRGARPGRYFRLESVDWSLQQLNDGQARVIPILLPMMKRQVASTSVDPIRNAVQISLADTAGESDRQVVQQAVEAAGVRVVVDTVPAEQLQVLAL